MGGQPVPSVIDALTRRNWKQLAKPAAQRACAPGRLGGAVLMGDGLIVTTEASFKCTLRSSFPVQLGARILEEPPPCQSRTCGSGDYRPMPCLTRKSKMVFSA